MKKSIIKTLLLCFVCLLAFVVSCGDNPDTPDDGSYKIEYELNGGTQQEDAAVSYSSAKSTRLPASPTKEGYNFIGWYVSADFSGEKVIAIQKGETGNKKFYAKWEESQASAEYAPRTELNKANYQLNGITVLIQVNPITSYDPTDSGYTGERKEDHLAHLTMLKSKYDVKLKYNNWEADWGPARIDYIKNNYLDRTFINGSELTYFITIATQWIPTLVKANCLAELYNLNAQEGIFTDFGYEQNDAINESCAVNGKVYGFAQGKARPDYFLYYNVDLAQKHGGTDPAELWMQGKWNWSTFVNWCKSAQASLGSDGYVLDLGYAPAAVGFVGAQGQAFVNPNSHKIMFTNSNVTSIVDDMLGLYGAYWNPKHGVQDVSSDFVGGTTIFQDGSIWYLKDDTRFGKDLNVGVVPYPVSDNDVVTPITQPYSYTDTEGNTVQVTEPYKNRKGETLTTDSGDPIYGVDYSSSTFRIPYTGSDCYSILDYDQTAVNGMNPTVAFSILYDLLSNFGDDPTAKQTNDEAYRVVLEKKLDNELDVDLIMSLQYDDLSYFELMIELSMTVGEGSHYGPHAFWPLMSGLAGQSSCYSVFSEVLSYYKAALTSIGY